MNIFGDANWTGDPSGRRSINEFYIYVGHILVSQYSRKQFIIAYSSTEVVYHVIPVVATEFSLLFISRFDYLSICSYLA